MGQGGESEHYRLLLEKELRRIGFQVADKAEDADAILTGTYSWEAHGNNGFARATVVRNSQRKADMVRRLRVAALGRRSERHHEDHSRELCRWTPKRWEKAGKQERYLQLLGDERYPRIMHHREMHSHPTDLKFLHRIGKHRRVESVCMSCFTTVSHTWGVFSLTAEELREVEFAHGCEQKQRTTQP